MMKNNPSCGAIWHGNDRGNLPFRFLILAQHGSREVDLQIKYFASSA
jgi:hypothetical protein